MELWPWGFSSTGAVTFASAAYVARYILKKITGEKAAAHYLHHPTTGEILQSPRKPEYTTMSRRPGIGSTWLKKWGPTDIWPGDNLVLNGAKMLPPKYYDKQLEGTDPKKLAQIKRRRVRKARTQAENNTPERLKVRETVLLSKLTSLKRDIE